MSTIENVPQQTYGAALLFSATPATSFMQTLFKHEIPRHISLRLLNEMSSEQHSGAVTSIAFTQDSTYLASASDDGTIRIWNSLNGLCRIVLEGHRYSVEALAFSQDSRFLISGSFDCSVKFWDTSSGVCLLNLEAHNSPIAAVSCSHDSLTVASGSSDGAVKHWSTSDDGVLLRTIQASYGPISSLGFSPNKSDHLMTVSIDSVIKVWNTNSGACLQIIDVGESLYDVAFDVPPLYLQTTVHEVSIGSSKLAGSQIPNQVYEVTGPQHMPLSRGYDRRVNDKWDYEWITSESGEILWIPPDFRPSCVRRNGNMIAFGLATGKVWLCLLDPLDLDSTHAETSWQENI